MEKNPPATLISCKNHTILLSNRMARSTRESLIVQNFEKMKIWIATLIPLVIGCSSPANYDLVLQNVGLFDGDTYHGIVNIGIHDDTIAVISSEKTEGDSLIDLSGKYIIPGMVNAHVHVSSVEQMKEGPAVGILTLLNMHTGEEDRELEWKTKYKDSAGFSTLYGAGHAATVPGGHPNQFSPDMETIDENLSIQDWVDHRIKNNVDYIKVVRDHHEWMGSPALPSLDYDQIRELIEYSHQKGMKVVIHANSIKDMMEIGQFSPDGFVHMPDYKEDLPVPENFYTWLAGKEIFVVPTAGFSLKSMDNAPPFIRDWVTSHLLDSSQRAGIIKKMHETGVLIVAGTDAQEGQMDFGGDYFLELKLYKTAGLSNIEILRTATGNAAKAFDLPIGQISVGSKASFVILNENPIEDIENLKTVYQVWKNGRTIPAHKKQ